LPAGLTIRPAARRDAAELAILVDIASHGFAFWLWYGAVIEGDVDTAMERGRQRMRDDRIDDGWKSGSIAEIGDEIVGASIGHRIAPDIADESEPHPSLAPLIALQQRVVGNWFVDTLAVYRTHRRQGIGWKLLESERVRAGDLPLSLITESYNAAALALYEAFGFRRIAQLDAFRLSESSTPHQWVLMTRPARG
jgi:ribosomal protein S18 acetylase RimI-like enzyme